MGNTTQVLTESPGIAVEMIQMLPLQIAGLEVQLKRIPWARCKAELKSNKVDGIFNASYKKRRLKLGWYPTIDGKHSGPVDPSKRITTISYSLYTLKKSDVQWNGQYISGVDGSIGAPLGYSIVNDLRQKGYKVDEAPSTRNNLDKLVLERIDILALQSVTADKIILSDPLKFQNVIKLIPPYATKPYYLMLSHNFVADNPKLSQEIWNAIRDIRNKKFDELVIKYTD